MTVIAIHAPPIELRRDESFSLREAAEQKALQQQQQQLQQQCLEYEEEEISPELDDEDMYAYKSVRFSIQPTTIHEYLSRKDMTPQEKADTWMTSRQLEPIREEMLFTRALMDTYIFQGDNLELTQRGLETRQRKLIRTCRSIVMQEQYRQTMKESTLNSEVLIASRYALANQKAAAVAQMRGAVDSQELTDMHLPERLAKEEAEGFGHYGSMNDDAEDFDDDESFSSDGSNEDDE
jgi:hypothetical protein